MSVKRTFEIEWDENNGPVWMNTGNLLACLIEKCPYSKFTVRDVTGDGQAIVGDETAGPRLKSGT